MCISIAHFPEELTEAQRGEAVSLMSYKELSHEPELELMPLSDLLVSTGSVAQTLGGSAERSLFPQGTAGASPRKFAFGHCVLP